MDEVPPDRAALPQGGLLQSCGVVAPVDVRFAGADGPFEAIMLGKAGKSDFSGEKK